MQELNTKDLKQALIAIATVIEEKKDWLCKLDGLTGDGDHGVTMSVGFNAVCASIKEIEDEAEPTALFNQAAKSFLNAMGGSAGPLYATAFMRAGASAKGKVALDATATGEAIMAMADGIVARGKAQAGEKTMLDAWLPAREAAQLAITAGNSLPELLAAVATAASAGAEATIQLQATKGRASRLGERSIGHMDPGAASTAILLETLAQFVAT